MNLSCATAAILGLRPRPDGYSGNATNKAVQIG
jgi:hypothetical protein